MCRPRHAPHSLVDLANGTPWSLQVSSRTWVLCSPRQAAHLYCTSSVVGREDVVVVVVGIVVDDEEDDYDGNDDEDGDDDTDDDIF